MIPNPIVLENFIGENSIKAFDILPSSPAISLLRGTLLYGRSLTENIYDLGLLVILTIAYLSIGLFVYSKKFFRPK